MKPVVSQGSLSRRIRLKLKDHAARSRWYRKHARWCIPPGYSAPAKEAPKQNESCNSPNHNDGKRYCMDTPESRFAVPEFDESYQANLSATTAANAILPLSSTSPTPKPPAGFCHWNHCDLIA